MAEYQTDIVINAQNNASAVADEIARDYAAMSAQLVSVLEAVAKASKGLEGAFRGMAAPIRETKGVFAEVAKTTKEVRLGFADMGARGKESAKQLADGSKDAGRAVGELGESSEKSSRRHQVAMSGAGAATRGALEVFKHFGPEATKQLASAGAAASDFAAKAQDAGKASGGAFDGVVSGARMAGDAIRSAGEKLNDLRVKAGKGLILGAVTQAAALGRGIAIAGQQGVVMASLKRELGEKGAEKSMGQLRDFDKRSPYDFTQTAAIAQRSLAASFKADELPDLMNALGNTASGTGGTAEDMEGIARALGQIKTKRKFSMEESSQLAERNINAPEILQKQLDLSPEQVAAMMEGKLTIAADIAVPALIKGLQEKFKGAMEAYMNTLPGAMSALKGSVDQAAASIGQHLVPMVIAAANAIRAVSDWFGNLPEPIQKVIAYTAAFVIGLGGLLGVLLLVVAPVLHAVSAFVTINLILGVLGVSISGLLVPALITAGIALAALVAAFGAAVYAWNLYANELAKPTSSVTDERTNAQKAEDFDNREKTRGVLKSAGEDKTLSVFDRIQINRAASQKLSDLGATDEAGKLLDENRRLASGAGGQQAIAEGAMRKSVANSPTAEKYINQFAGLNANTSARLAAPPAPPATVPEPQGALGGLTEQLKAALKANPIGGKVSASTATGIPSGGTGAQTDIETLEDQLRATDDKGEKKEIGDKLFYARRAQRHDKQNEAAQRKAEAKAKAQAKKDEAQAKREEDKARRDAGFGARANAAESGAEIDERIAGLQSRGEVSDLRDKRGMNAEIRTIKGAMKAGTIGKEAGGKKIDVLKALYDARNRARDADMEAQIAELEAQKTLAEGEAAAAGQTGAQRVATLRIAATKAARIRDIGRLKAGADREEAQDAWNEAQKRARDIQDDKAIAANKELSAALAAGRLAASFDRTPKRDGRMFGMPSMRRAAPSISLDEPERTEEDTRTEAPKPQPMRFFGLPRAAPPVEETLQSIEVPPVARIEAAPPVQAPRFFGLPRRSPTPPRIETTPNAELLPDAEVPQLRTMPPMFGMRPVDNSRNEAARTRRARAAIAKGAKYENNELFIPDNVIEDDDDERALLKSFTGMDSTLDPSPNPATRKRAAPLLSTKMFGMAPPPKVDDTEPWAFSDKRPDAPASFTGRDAAARAAGLARAGVVESYRNYTNQGVGFGEAQKRKAPQLRAVVLDVFQEILGGQVATVKVMFDDNDSNASGARLMQAG